MPSNMPHIGDLNELRQLLASPIEPFIVAIDFEATQKITSGFRKDNTQSALVILDTEAIKPIATGVNQFHAVNFVTGTDLYFLENTTRPLWGFSERVNKSELVDKITRLYTSCTAASPITGPQTRPTILVGHNVQAEIRCLSSLGFDFSKIDYIFDTYLMAQHDLDFGSLKLIDLVQSMGFPVSVGPFHTASNDAVFTLRAFLGIMYHYVPNFGKASLKTKLQQAIDTGFSVLYPSIALPDFTTPESRKQPPRFTAHEMPKLSSSYDKVRSRTRSRSPKSQTPPPEVCMEQAKARYNELQALKQMANQHQDPLAPQNLEYQHHQFQPSPHLGHFNHNFAAAPNFPQQQYYQQHQLHQQQYQQQQQQQQPIFPVADLFPPV